MNSVLRGIIKNGRVDLTIISSEKDMAQSLCDAHNVQITDTEVRIDPSISSIQDSTRIKNAQALGISPKEVPKSGCSIM